MLYSYLQMAFRQLRQSKLLSAINILGLSAGLAASFVILIYLDYQTSFDRFHRNLANIYLVTKDNQLFGVTEPNTPMILGPTLRGEFPEVVSVARWDSWVGKVRYRDRTFEESWCTYADPEVFDIFTLPLVSGNREAISRSPDFLVVSETIARKYFGGKDPVGEVVSLQCGKRTYELTVVAVMKDLPSTSSIRCEMVGPLYIVEDASAAIWKTTREEIANKWSATGGPTYVLLKPSADLNECEKRLVALSIRNVEAQRKETFHFFPFRDAYFHASSLINSPFVRGNIVNVYVYSGVALLILIVSCINYLLFNLGKVSLRTKEVGLRKVFGARLPELFVQTVVEASLVVLLALPLAIVFVEFFLHDLTTLLGTPIAAAYYHAPAFIFLFIVVALGIGLVSGSYVTVYMARCNVAAILKGSVSSGQRRALQRRILLASQMIVFLGLTLASVAIMKQIRYLLTTDFGFDRERVFVFDPEYREFAKEYETFKNEVKKVPGVVSVTGGTFVPATESYARTKYPRKDDPTQLVTVDSYMVDQDFVETLGMKMVSGESFRKANVHPGNSFCLVNESAVNALGLAAPVGTVIGGATILGVVSDFNMHSLRSQIAPGILRLGTEWINEVAVRIRPDADQATAKRISEIGARFNNGNPIEYQSFEDRVGDMYQKERQFGQVIGYATALAIVIASLGVFGMSIFVSQQRVKEVGIRKVLGASVRDIYLRLIREFVGVALLSCIVAYPVATYLVSAWLDQFAYHVRIGVTDFLIAAVVDVVIVLATISYQVFRVIRSNPIVSLRYE